MFLKFVEKHESRIHRILEILPGLFSWAVIFSPVWLGIIYPPALVYFLIFLCVYWCYLAIKATIGGYIGYKRYKKEMATDWMAECTQLDFANLPDKSTLPPSLEETKHFILIPTYSEPYEVLKGTIESIINQTYPISRIILAVTIEEKHAPRVIEDLDRLLEGHKEKFEDVQYHVHPKGIEGEAIGAAAANRRWGATHAVDKMTSDGRNIRNYIFSTFDSDHVLDKQYIARLTHLYLSSDERDYRSFSTAVYLFNNNHWEVPTIMRIEANFVTMGNLSGRSYFPNIKAKDTFAAYSASLQTLIDADYWDASLGIDDTIFYWRAFFVRNGHFIATSHYIPFSADAVGGDTKIQSYKNLYKQLLRWGYGVIDFPLSMMGFLKNNRVPLGTKLNWIFQHIHKRLILINITFLITFGFTIATLVNPVFRQTIFAYSVPNVMSTLLSFTMIFLIPGFILRSKITRSMPEHWPFWRKALILLESPLVIVNLLTYSFVPYVDAQTRMLLGKKMKDLYHTQKVR